MGDGTHSPSQPQIQLNGEGGVLVQQVQVQVQGRKGIFIDEVCLKPGNIDEEREIIKKLWKEAEGNYRKFDKWYLISYKWFCSWRLYVGFDGESESERSASKPGPIDNTDLQYYEKIDEAEDSSSSSSTATTTATSAATATAEANGTSNNVASKGLVNGTNGNSVANGTTNGTSVANGIGQVTNGATDDTSSKKKKDVKDSKDKDKENRDKEKENGKEKSHKEKENGKDKANTQKESIPTKKSTREQDEIDANFMSLKAQLVEDYHYSIVPQKVWMTLKSWYNGGPELYRMLVEPLFRKKMLVEVYPHRLLIRKHGPEMKEIVYYASKDMSLRGLVYYVSLQMNTPPNSARIYKESMKDSGEYRLLDDLNLSLSDCGVHNNHKLVLEVKLPNGEYPGEIPLAKDKANQTNILKHGDYYPSYSGVSAQVYKPSSEPPIQIGVTGLTNLGNTCFMNSAVQCLSNTVTLTEYFLSDKYKSEINTTNPLGTKGKLVTEYAELLNAIWKGDVSYTPPLNFRTSLCKFAPQFSGYRQHDAQELLAYLLDGLHEDLNLIVNKQLTTAPSADGKTDAILAKEFWETHLKRNCSIIVKLFHGQLKSTLVCPVCNNISITFDPFMFLSVPLPTSGTRQLQVILYGKDIKREKDDNDKSSLIKFKLTVPVASKVHDLKKALAAASKSYCQHIIAGSLILTDVVNGKIYSVLADASPIFNLRPSDTIIAYDLYPYSATQAERIFGTTTKKTEEEAKSKDSSEKNEKKEKEKKNKKNKEKKSKVKEKEKEKEKGKGKGKEKEKEQEQEIECEGEKIDESKFKVLKVFFRKISTVKGKNTGTEFGSPLITVISKTITQKALLEFGMQHVRVNITAQEGKEVHLVILRPVLPDGTSCTKCKKADCFGCELVSSEHSSSSELIDLSAVSILAIDLDESVKWKNSMVDPSMTVANPSEAVTLKDCIELFLMKEQLSADDPWYCSVCKEHQPATKKFDLWRLPDILIIHLKRFQYTKYFREKLETYVDFPSDELDMTNYELCHSNLSAKYQLYAVVNHMGILVGGHYTAYGINKLDDSWYLFNDNSCSLVKDPSEIKSSNAYVLFYKRKT